MTGWPREPAPFRPAPWLPGPHLQTLGGRLLRRLDRMPPRKERLELPDGDFIDLHEFPTDLPEDAPTVLVLHGLEGSSRANYVSSTAHYLNSLGLRAVRFNFRACSGEMNRLPRSYHAGDTDDLDFVVRHLREREPDRPLAVIGFSLGGNILLKYLGERGGDAARDICAAVAISVPFDLRRGTHRLEAGGMSRFYTLYFVRKLRRKAVAKRALLVKQYDVDAAIRARTVRAFDEALTARLHGFRDAWDYYESSSCVGYLDDVRVPTLVLHSLDDPFLPTDAVPVEALRNNPCLIEGITPEGGHVGFVEGTPWNPVFWADREAARFAHAGLRLATAPAAPGCDGNTRV